jgi:hypothetical protein
MANYSDSLDSYSAGSGLPSGFTDRFDSGTWSVVDDSGDKLIREASAGNNRYFASMDAVDSDADRDDVEVLGCVRLSSVSTTATTYAGVACRGSGTNTTETCYAALLVDAGSEKRIRLAKYVSGTLTVIAEVAFSTSANTKYWIRLRANSTAIKVRVWADGGSEPGTWAIEQTDSSVTGTGWAGFFGFLGGINKELLSIAVATNGDTATIDATQTLTATLVTNTSTFYAPSVMPTLTATLVTNTTSFHAASISQGSGQQNLTATLVTNTSTFHAATVSNVFEIDDNYERSSVKLADSSVSGYGDDAVITIKPRFQASEVTSSELRWLEPSALVTGLNGFRPTFRFSSYLTSGSGSYHGQPWQAARRPMFSYDRSTWTYFDTAVTVNTTDHWIEFRHSTAFTSNTVYISRGRQMSVEQVGAWIDDLETTYPTIIEPTTSAAAFTPTLTSWSGQSFIADEFSSQTNELSETIPATPFYAFQINDTSLTPLDGSAKQLAVVTSGVHAGEDHGNFVLKAFIDAVLDSTTTGQYLRRNYKILVYPMINAPGRAGGGWRGSFTLGTGSIDDANRHFSDASPGLEIITKPRTAMATDRGSETPHWAIDFHGTYANAWALFVDTGNTFQDTFKTLLGTNSGQTIADEGDTHAGFVSRYYQDTVGSRLAITHESGDPSQVTDANIVTQGVGIADSLYDIFQIVAPSAFTNTSTFHAPTVTPGAVTLTPSLVENTSTFYAATISQPSTQTLTASLLQNSNTFYAHVIANVTPTVRRVGGGGYLVELDGKRKQPSPSISDDEEIMEILAAIMPAIEAQRFAMGRVQ